jgi:CRISPR-associated protein Csb1
MTSLTLHDRYLAVDDGPAALVIREHLMPAEGAGGVLFPATFAPGDGFPGGYNIDTDPGGRTVCLIDSVGSQANRMEPLFKADRYRHLVPQVVVQAGEKEVNLLDVGHRAGDALVRCSALLPKLRDAFAAVLGGDAAPLAGIAPTSLVFGVWDSRDTQVRLPRLVTSTVRAFGVQRLTRSAQYVPPIDYAAVGVVGADDRAKGEASAKSTVAQRGFVHVPSPGTHGGIIAAEVRRDASLSLVPLRQLAAGKDGPRGLALRRYLLGLSLVAFTHPPGGYLRQGCVLVRDPTRAAENEFVEVYFDGDRKPISLTHTDAVEYATRAAAAFGVGESLTVPFDPDKARAEARGEQKKKAAKGAKP